jgi:uncharacterized protein YukE
VSSVGAHTDFEYYSHEEMLAMIKDADPEALASFGHRLTKAVQSIHDIGNDLNDHIGYVEWEGRSGSAFKEWGKQVAKATLSLGDYAQTAGKAMTDAADTLRAVKRDMPPVPADAKATVDTFRTDFAAHHDPDFQKEYSKASSQLSSARIEAADQMTKLAQSYSFSSTQINGQTPPTYPPAPSVLLPADHRSDVTHYSVDSGRTSGGTQSSTGSTTTPHRSVVTPTITDETLTPVTHGTVHPGHVQPVVLPPTDTTTDLDSTIPVHPPTTPLPTVPSVPHQQQVGPVAPTVPNTFLPPTATTPSLPVAPGGLGRTAPGFFRGGLTAATPGEFPGGRVVAGAPGVRPGAPTGIYGGQQAEEEMALGGRMQPQIARGSVVGGTGAAARPPVAGGAAGTGGGTVRGRGTARARLTTEEGGEVGRTPAGAFAGAQTPRENEEREGTRRPDHLVEDEETWAGRGDVAPPVID